MEKPSDSGKRGMKAFNDPRENSSRSWPHPSHDGEVAPQTGPDERNQTGILTSNSSLTPAFPAVLGPVACGSLSFVTVA
jgi:hypothetical protein